MFLPHDMSGDVDIYMPDGRSTTVKLTIDRNRRPRDGEIPYVTLAFHEDYASFFADELTRKLLKGDLKALNLDWVVRVDEPAHQVDPPSGGNG